MGIVYTVACRDCKVSRCLDKAVCVQEVKDRNDALRLAEYIQTPKQAFRAALLVSFMAAHQGHNCTVFSDDMDWLAVDLDSMYGKTKADGEFWEK